MVAPSENGPQITWANIISTLGFGVVLIGMLYAVIQTQFSADRERTALISGFHDREVTILAATAKERGEREAAWAKERAELFQQQLDRREGDIARRLDAALVEINARRAEYLTIREFNLVKETIASLREQIKTLEVTRPTTGELAAIGTANKEQIAKLEERVRSLEDNLRTTHQSKP